MPVEQDPNFSSITLEIDGKATKLEIILSLNNGRFLLHSTSPFKLVVGEPIDSTYWKLSQVLVAHDITEHKVL